MAEQFHIVDCTSDIAYQFDRFKNHKRACDTLNSADYRIFILNQPCQRIAGLIDGRRKSLVKLRRKSAEIQTGNPTRKGVYLVAEKIQRRSGADRAILLRASQLPELVFDRCAGVAELGCDLLERRLVAPGVHELFVGLIERICGLVVGAR